MHLTTDAARRLLRRLPDSGLLRRLPDSGLLRRPPGSGLLIPVLVSVLAIGGIAAGVILTATGGQSAGRAP
ncbi:MAG TPA: hypothetical protein VIX15_19620 [Streptosporangiaceae bacterium]